MKKILRTINRRIRNEAGQALVVVLLLLGLGSLLIAPLLSYTGTGLQAGQVYEVKADEFYAADAGVEDALWIIRNDRLEAMFGTYPASGAYDPYAYYDPVLYPDNEWSYILGEDVNGKVITVEIKNMWMPKGINTPEANMARVIIQGLDEDNPPKLIVTGNAPAGTDEYEINITFLPASGEEGDLLMQTIGVWLPPGFSYVPESSWLDDPANSSEPYYSVPEVSQHAGGTAVIWRFSDVAFTEFPGVDADSIQKYTLTFEYESEKEGRLPEGVAWLETTGVDDVSYAWDADIRVFRINSIAYSPDTDTDTEIEAYSVKSEVRQLVSAISGDYYATGNAYLYDGGHLHDYRYRDTMYSSRDAVVASTPGLDPIAGVPEDAAIVGAYLYWTGWIDHDGYDDGGGATVVWSDDTSSYGTTTDVWSDDTSSYGTTTAIWTENCSSYYDTPSSWPFRWNNGSHWSNSSNRFWGRGGGSSADKTLTSETIPLAGYTGQDVVLSVDISESGAEGSDILYYQFYNSGGWSGQQEIFNGDDSPGTYTIAIPDGYLTDDFQVMFYWYANYSNDNVYLDNITISTFSGDWDPGANWDIYNNDQFRCYGGGSTDDRTLTRVTSIDLSAYSGQTVELSADMSDQNAEGGDILYVEFYNASGWGSQQTLYEGNYGSGNYSVTIPEAYLTADFLMRFYWSTTNSNEYVYIDDIDISVSSGYTGLEYYEGVTTDEEVAALVENNARVNTVLFGSTEDNMTQVYADNYDVTMPEIINGYGFDEGEGTWSYCCYADVTSLVTQWIEAGDQGLGDNGAGTYTVSNAFIGVANEVDPSYSWNFADGGTTGYPLGTPADTTANLKDQNAHCGWSIILIYSSPETRGHQLYLYDINHPGFNYTQARRTDPDFDGDGLPGGVISGFLAPEEIATESEAARATVFGGEGDDFITGDYFKVNGVSLEDGTGFPVNNVWNSNSQGLSLAGIDIDTFSTGYPVIQPGDVEAQINIPTDDDSIHIVYIILSFRSEIFIGGTMTYIIR
jgi:hypothetical protein